MRQTNEVVVGIEESTRILPPSEESCLIIPYCGGQANGNKERELCLPVAVSCCRRRRCLLGG